MNRADAAHVPQKTATRLSGTSCRIARTSRWRFGSGYTARRGTWRGGLGVTRHLEMMLPTVLTANADRHILPPTGLFGGGTGAVNRFSIIRDGENRTFKQWFDIPSPSKFSNMATRAGDILTVTQGGGGGYGDPLLRDPALVAADVLDGYVSLEHARTDYGVILDPETRQVDASATEREREERQPQNGSATTPQHGRNETQMRPKVREVWVLEVHRATVGSGRSPLPAHWRKPLTSRHRC